MRMLRKAFSNHGIASRALAAAQHSTEHLPGSLGAKMSGQEDVNASSKANTSYSGAVFACKPHALPLALSEAINRPSINQLAALRPPPHQARTWTDFRSSQTYSTGKDQQTADASKESPSDLPAAPEHSHAGGGSGEPDSAGAAQASSARDNGPGIGEQPSASAGGQSEAERSAQSREAWTKSEEYARMSAEMKRIAGLNKLETGQKVEANDPLTMLADGLRFVRVSASASDDQHPVAVLLPLSYVKVGWRKNGCMW